MRGDPCGFSIERRSEDEPDDTLRRCHGVCMSGVLALPEHTVVTGLAGVRVRC